MGPDEYILNNIKLTGQCIEYTYTNISKEYTHYENMPIQIYWKFYHQKMKNFR